MSKPELSGLLSSLKPASMSPLSSGASRSVVMRVRSVATRLKSGVGKDMLIVSVSSVGGCDDYVS